ncbi:MAG: T9SS type A sorting domain-containing protein, partial [candidate division WOR-3 bacterium]|nr:T9SS type A sorting domain-containing protein [candidate division WOR-3 bacterium]
KNNQQGNLTTVRFNRLPDLSNSNYIIYDAVGRKVRIAQSKEGRVQGLKPGIYFIASFNDKGYNFKKIVIIR